MFRFHDLPLTLAQLVDGPRDRVQAVGRLEPLDELNDPIEFPDRFRLFRLMTCGELLGFS